MRRNPVIPWIVLGAAVACIAVPPAGATSQDASPTTGAPGGTATAASSLPSKTAEPSSSPTSAFPPVTGAEPSGRVAAFYYPWYRTLATDGYWDHWITSRFQPPLDIPSDYYPALGAYSVADPAVVAQHFAWLRGAGVGVIISSWWGQGTREDKAVPLLLDIGQRYGIKVAFHIEPYGGRTADRLLQDIRYLYRQYGDHPAFFRSAAASRWSQEGVSKGLFFVWAIGVPDFDNPAVGPDYWQEAVDAIHGLPDGGLVIANTTESNWIDGGHFDGLYNYATLNLGESGGFSWARGLPPDAWYVPSVLPGFSAKRIAYPEEDYVPRLAGATYAEQWRQALDTGVEPALVTITSFNEWHEGSQIEPAAEGAANGLGYVYESYNPLPPEGYLALTRQLADRFLATVWPDTRRVRIRLTTTSDWTTLSLLSGAAWLRPGLVSASEAAGYAGMEADHLLLGQPIGRAQAGGKVEMTVDFLLTGWESGGTLVFEIGRGNLGWTNVDFFNVSGPEPVLVKTFTWAGINPGPRNALTVKIPVEDLLTGQ
jgi:glycoprotein endo-alpha-1,2-mannosidase